MGMRYLKSYLNTKPDLMFFCLLQKNQRVKERWHKRYKHIARDISGDANVY